MKSVLDGNGEEETHGRPPQQGLDVLIVEDDASVRENFEGFLRTAGYPVMAAPDGPEALSLCALKRFDVVISDVRLPKLDGLALLRRLRTEAPDIDVILVTGYAAVSEAVVALKAGAHDYLTK